MSKIKRFLRLWVEWLVLTAVLVAASVWAVYALPWTWILGAGLAGTALSAGLELWEETRD